MSLFLRLLVSCWVLGTLTVPAHAYNSPTSDGPDVGQGHSWITNKAIDYLKTINPFAYILANKYREQLIRGAWFADHNSGSCNIHIPGIERHWPCDSTNHYEPKFFFTFGIVGGIGPGAAASVSASEYARDLFAVAANCWSSRDLPESALPDACRVPEWRAVFGVNIVGDFGEFSSDGSLVRISPLTLLGWALHMLQDQMQPYHTYSMPANGHQEFEDYADAFIKLNGDRLLLNAAGAPIEVSSPEEFVQRVADETQRGAFVFLFDQNFVNCAPPDPFEDLIPPSGPDRPSVPPDHTFVPCRPTDPRPESSPQPLFVCCRIPDNQLDTVVEAGLNRAIIYSAKLLEFYLRKPAEQLSSAIFQAIAP
jgi:hypothetical protein